MQSFGKIAIVMSAGLIVSLAGCDSDDKKSTEAKAPAAASAPASAPAPATEAAKSEATKSEAPKTDVATAPATPPAAAPVTPTPAPSSAPAPAAPAAAHESAASGPSKGGGSKGEDGKYMLPSGEPTFNIAADGTVDWYTYSGYKRFHSECHVCHGPGADGSSFAPALADSLKTMDYQTFVTTVMSGRITDKGGTKFVMPALGDNKNVACFIDDLYAYIRARAVGDLPFGRPEKREEKPQAAKDYEKSCFGD